jgi:hypothetical protein
VHSSHGFVDEEHCPRTESAERTANNTRNTRPTIFITQPIKKKTTLPKTKNEDDRNERKKKKIATKVGQLQSPKKGKRNNLSHSQSSKCGSLSSARIKENFSLLSISSSFSSSHWSRVCYEIQEMISFIASFYLFHFTQKVSKSSMNFSSIDAGSPVIVVVRERKAVEWADIKDW